jgi:L-ascorbate metabolism protein UlaG (beta-lactamase superfamily)
VAEILHYVQDDNAWHRGTDSVDKLTRLPWPFVIRISLFLRASSFVIRHLPDLLCESVDFHFGLLMTTQLTYFGHSGFKLQTPSGKVLLIDPWLKNPLFKKGEDELRKLDRVDVICITHGHFDHVGDSVEIAGKTKAKLLCTFDLAIALRNALGFPGEDSSLVGHLGGEIHALDGEVIARFVPAWHGAAIMPNEKSAPVYGGTPSGVVLSVENGPTIYHTGDTDLFSDMALVPLERPIDWMLVCMGGHFTMGPTRAARAVELVKAKSVIPIHFATFPVLTGTPEMLADELKKLASKAQVRAMKPGEAISLSV